jgi:SAM-dependent methyltransferase
VRFDVLDVAVCPGCRFGPLRRETFRADERGEPLDGVVHCPQCRRWYPLEDRLLELLVEPLGYAEDRERFRTTYDEQIRAAGLDPGGTPDTTVDRSDEILHQQEHFDWYADNTVQTYAAYEQLPFWQALDAITFERWRRQIRPGTRLLDVGCAQGRSTFKLVDQAIDVVAFDISKRLVRQAIDRAGPDDNVTFLVADATSLPFVDASFDYVLTYGVLHHVPEPSHLCQEIGRLLRPGGTFFASENNRSALRAGFELLQRLRPLWHEEAGEFAQISRQQMTDWLEGAGLSVSIRTSVFLPPHALNRVKQETGERVLEWTDRVGNAVPGLRGNGGLVVAEGVKQPAA